MNKLILITLIIVTSIFASSCNNNKMPRDLELRKENINQTMALLDAESQYIDNDDIEKLIEKWEALKDEIIQYTEECNKRGIEKNNDKSINSIIAIIEELESKIPEKIIPICDQWSSKNAVENRIENLGYVQLSIQLNSTSGCRYQWLVQFISDAGQSGYCAITTDGSSGIVEIVNVTCNWYLLLKLNEFEVMKSKIFECILRKVCNGLNEPFTVNDVVECLKNSKPFLAKHAIDPKNKQKKIYGTPFFIRESRGKYIINPKYKTCP